MGSLTGHPGSSEPNARGLLSGSHIDVTGPAGCDHAGRRAYDGCA